MRILIVEDEVRLAEALAQIMAEQKYQVDQPMTKRPKSAPWFSLR